jgi:carboxypeptidase Taq
MYEDWLKELKERGREIYLLEHTAALLGWDQETYIPEKAVEERSEQLALLESMAHEKLAHPRVAELLEKLGATLETPRGTFPLSDVDAGFVRHFYRRHRREVCFPDDLVREFARRTSMAQSVWARAKKSNDFALFAPELKKIVVLVRERARLLKVGTHPYDALIDTYEPGMTKEELDRIFIPLKKELTSLVAQIKTRPQPENDFFKADYPLQDQRRLGDLILSRLGYPLDRGRLDISAHPFTTTLGADDVRITTRYGEPNPFNSFFSTVHEAGHGLYELGFGDTVRGNLLADGTSLGIHESQSRTWENLIARSRPFWHGFYGEVQKLFPAILGEVPEETFYKAVNRVSPSFIRVDADEVTYSLHVILRYELETALMEGTLEVEDLPRVWDDKMEEFLGIRPDKASLGVLQDVHWSAGLFGYFPTYALGNLYGAQLFLAARKDLTALMEDVEAGRFAPFLDWLRRSIHQHGSVYTASELIQKITGEPLNPGYFSAYLKEKYQDIYGGTPFAP